MTTVLTLNVLTIIATAVKSNDSEGRKHGNSHDSNPKPQPVSLGQQKQTFSGLSQSAVSKHLAQETHAERARDTPHRERLLAQLL